MKAKTAGRRFTLSVLVIILVVILPAFIGSQSRDAAFASTNLSVVSASSDPQGAEIGTDGGIVDLPGDGEFIVPSGALSAPIRVSRYSVEMRLAAGLLPYHPIDQPVTIEARRSDNQTSVTKLQRPATIRLKLDRPEISKERLKSPAIRVLQPKGWEIVPASYDATSMTFTISITDLPITLAVVDESEPVGDGEWDPFDPAAVQFGDGSWGVAYVDGTTNLMYRRYLNVDQYWQNSVTVDTGADSPALVKLGSTLALFYRKSTGGVKQVFIRTSTDDGISWSSATQLTTETVNIYQIQSSNISGTVYLFWSISDASGLLQYRTSTDLTSWTAKASVGQAIGPLQSNTYPVFDIKQF
ncbi:MAG: hypothetical protein HY663_04625, partial [Chloroflexi bacterium]|nr:hypothetical protein [Chloroflexota bacterium]